MIRLCGAMVLLVIGSASALADPQVSTLRSGGPSEDRVDLVLLAEGYTASERETFEAHAEALVEGTFAHPLFSRYAKFFNVHAVFEPAASSGVLAHDAPDGVGGTVFGTRFRAASGTFVRADWSRVQRVALAAPDVDKMVVLCNTPRDVGMRSGNVVFVSQVETVDTTLHELGHLLGNLADEYVRSGSWTSPEAIAHLLESPRPNVAPTSEREALPWRAWIEAETPVPARPGTSGVSAWEGGFTVASGVFRPRDSTCRMRYYRNGPFCEPCREAIVASLYRLTGPSSVHEVASESGRRFEIRSVVPSETRAVRWSAEGGGEALAELLRRATQAKARSVTIRPGVVDSAAVLSVTVADETPWVRRGGEALRLTRSFELERQAAPRAATGAAGRVSNPR